MPDQPYMHFSVNKNPLNIKLSKHTSDNNFASGFLTYPSISINLLNDYIIKTMTFIIGIIR